MMILLAKTLISLLLALLGGWLLLSVKAQQKVTAMSWGRLSQGFVASRLAVWFALFVVGGVGAQSDVGVYLNQARWTLEGKQPFADFETAYGPLNGYFMAGFIWLWNNAAMLVLLAVLFEIGAWFVWNKVLRDLLPDVKAKVVAVLYALAPLALLNTAMVGLNHIWLSFFLALGTWWLMRARHVSSGLALGVSIVLVKFLSLLFVPMLGWMSQRKVRWSVGFLVPVIAGYSWLFAQGVNPFGQVAMHAHYNSSGNLPYLAGVMGIDPSNASVRTFFNLLGVGVLSLGFIWAVWSGRVRSHWQLLLSFPLVLLVTLLVSKKSFSAYLEIAQLPLLVVFMVLAERSRFAVAVFVTLMVTTSLEPSLWFRWLRNRELVDAMTWVPPWEMSIFLVVEVLMLLCYVYLVRQIWLLLKAEHYPSIS
jgi:hypothetical protein